ERSREVRAGYSRAPAGPLRGGVAPQGLHRVGAEVLALDVAHRSWDRNLVRRAGGAERGRKANVSALVAVLVGVERVVPAAVVARAAADDVAHDVLGTGIGDR